MSSSGGNLKKYKRLKYLGKGSYGAAILVELRANPKQRFVIKEIVIGHLKDVEQNAAKKEAEVLHQMQHSNITMYVESFVESSKLFIVMEYADGGDLSTVLAKRKKAETLWPENELMRIFVQICLALKHVHEQNILHRDLKAANIFLSSKGIIKLGDFGIAKVLDSTEEQARTQIGTPYYLSPEICESLPYGRQSDVWSLGIVLFELLTFELPFQAQSLPALVHRICTVEPMYEKVDKSYSRSITELVKSLLHKDPLQRPTLQQVVSTDFLKAHICKLLSHTLKVGTGGVHAEKVEIRTDENEHMGSMDTKHSTQSCDYRTINAEEADRDIEKARKRQKEAEERVISNRQIQREAEREKLRKFKGDMLRNQKNGKSGNDLVVVKEVSNKKQANSELNGRDNLLRQQEDRIRELERLVYEQQKEKNQEIVKQNAEDDDNKTRMQYVPGIQDPIHKSPSRGQALALARNDGNHFSPARKSLSEMQEKGLIDVPGYSEVRHGYAVPIMQHHHDRDDIVYTADQDHDIVRQQFFHNRAAAAAVKARVEAEERGIDYAHHTDGNPQYISDQPTKHHPEYGENNAEARIAMLRAERERSKEAELVKRQKQLQLAYAANRDERKRFATRTKETASSVAFEISMDATIDNSKPKPVADGRRPKQEQNIIIASIDDQDDSSVSEFDRKHLDDDVAEGTEGAVLMKLRARRLREKEARENARIAFRRLQERRASTESTTSMKDKNGHRKDQPTSVLLQGNSGETNATSNAQNENENEKDETDLSSNINSWLTRQHNDFLRDRKVSAGENQQLDDAVDDHEVTDLQTMLANALLGG